MKSMPRQLQMIIAILVPGIILDIMFDRFAHQHDHQLFSSRYRRSLFLERRRETTQPPLPFHPPLRPCRLLADRLRERPLSRFPV